MNISTHTRTTSAQWFRRSIVALGALLIAGTTILGLVNRTSSEFAPATLPAVRLSSASSAAQLRYEDFKLRQIEDTAVTRVSTPSAAQLRYEDFKLRQVEDTAVTRVSALSAAQLRYEDFKLRQIERFDSRSVNRAGAAPPTAQTRWENFKLQQIDR